MSLLSPAATYHAELREELSTVGRTLSVQRALVWLGRGLAAGMLVVLGVVIWAWTRDAVSSLPLGLLAATPIVLGGLLALGTLFLRQDTRQLARRVDRAANLHERSTTALELGARGDEHPLALAQMRDAVEHLKRIDMLEAFPLRLPRRELMVAAGTLIIAVLIGVSPNPWILQARAANPAISVAHEQAQRVQRVADTIPQSNSPELEQLRQLLSKGAQTMDARSNEPDAALNALSDLEDQIRQLSAGDDQLAAALGAIASALAGNQSTQQLANAINTGDLRQISQALSDLAQQAQQMDPGQRAQLAQTLQAASQAAAPSSQGISSDLANAANALAASASADDASDPNAAAQNQQGAANALSNLSQSAAAAGQRQAASNQLEASQNALERALGQTQSRSGRLSSSSSSTNGSSTNSFSSQQGSGQGNQGSQSPSQSGDGQGQGQGQDQASGGDQGSNGGGSSNDQQSGDGGSSSGSGYSTGGQGQDHTGAESSLDGIVAPQQVPTNGNVTPDQSSQNPYLTNAGQNSASANPEAVQPAYSNQPTQGQNSSSIPLGLRDLVKDYFSSLDQK